MKIKIVIVIVLSAIILGGGVYETVYVNKTFDEFTKKMEALVEEEIIEIEDVTEVEAWWKKEKEKLEISIPHEQLNEVSVTLGELHGAVEREDYDSAMALCVRIKGYSDSIKHMYAFLINNII